jgi:hypothetical protein
MALVFVTTFGGSHGYGIRRVNATTMSISATTTSGLDSDPPLIGDSPTDQLWAEAVGGAVIQFDPASLRTEYDLRVFSASSADMYGVLVTARRVFVTDGARRELYSFPAAALPR